MDAEDPVVTWQRPGTCQGWERLGAKTARYIVRVRVGDATPKECELKLETWKKLQPGSHLKAKVRSLTGGLDCGSLTP